MDSVLKTLFDADRLRASSVTVDERREHNDARNDFESDLGRALFSSAARRLHDKTQVIPLTSDDNVHSRLTHSMEVMNIGASLAKDICFNARFREKYGIENIYEVYEPMRAILQTVCLVHDIGNPPFGHFGEFAICEYFKKLFNEQPHLLGGYNKWSSDFTSYDGNAQGFRVITKLQFIDDLYGLNLTKTCLATYLKYPTLDKGDKKSTYISCRKHGVFWADKDYMEQVMNSCKTIGENSYSRHPFVYLVEAADSICYLSMDLEDAYNKGWFSPSKLLECRRAFSKENTGTAATLFAALESVVGTTSAAERKGFIRFRINIIKYLVTLAVDNYLNNFDKIVAGDYNKELIFDDVCGVAEFLQWFCVKYIYCRKEIRSVELTGWSVINGMLDIYTKLFLSDHADYMRHGEAMMSQSVLRANKMDYLVHSKAIEWSADDCCYVVKRTGCRVENTDELCDGVSIGDLPVYYRLRMIVDFISSMTDKFAVQHYQKLSGQRI